MTNEDIRLALESLLPDAKYSLAGDDYENIEWVSDFEKPTIEEIEAEIKLLPKKKAAEIKAKETAKAALLTKLGITADEAALLLS
jgi:hypothetical protein